MSRVDLTAPAWPWQNATAYDGWPGSAGWENTAELRLAYTNAGTPHQIICQSGTGTGLGDTEYPWQRASEPFTHGGKRKTPLLHATCWCGKETCMIPATWIHKGWTLACHRTQCQYSTDLTPLPYWRATYEANTIA